MVVSEVSTRDYVSKSNLPQSDFVINPYGGCPHGCMYCYASFMKRFSGHTEPWGEYVDIKMCSKPLSARKLMGKDVTIGSVTDPYNPYEKDYCITHSLLKQLVNIPCNLYIITKSKLILRDLELLKQQKNLVVAISLNTLDEGFRADMDKASTVQERLDTMRTLHEAGVYVVLFCSPMFPLITDYKSLVAHTVGYVDEYWFENLNLRGDYKTTVMNYIRSKYPHIYRTYEDIYYRGQTEYWTDLERRFTEYCNERGIKFLSAFDHSKLVADAKAGKKWR